MIYNSKEILSREKGLVKVLAPNSYFSICYGFYKMRMNSNFKWFLVLILKFKACKG